MPRPALFPPALLLAPLLLAALGSACAHPVRAPDEARLLRLDVVDRDRGLTLPQFRDGRQAWVAGEEGQPYTLRLQNLGPERLLVVLSVDGVNVVTGASAAPGQSGYVLGPWAVAEIDGWRKSMDEVAAFRFSAAGDSYAARTGRPFDLGVIGAAVFRERPLPPEPWPMPAPPLAESSRDRQGAAADSRADAAAAESVAPAAQARAMAPAPASPLGTAHGERRWSPTTQTTFERASPRPDEVLALRYDRHDALVARGVIRESQPWARREPRPFPGGFVPDP